MEKNIEMSMLCQTYGKLLTKKQYDVLNDYYNNDLSLSEIAENLEITRQAVRDNLKKGENKLLEYEKKLGIMKKTMEQEETITAIISEVEKITENSSDKEVGKILEHIRHELKCLV